MKINTEKYSFIYEVKVGGLMYRSDENTKYYYSANEEVIAVTKHKNGVYHYNVILEDGKFKHISEVLENIFEEYPDSIVELKVFEDEFKDYTDCPLSEEAKSLQNAFFELINKNYLRAVPSGFSASSLELKNMNSEFITLFTARTGIF